MKTARRKERGGLRASRDMCNVFTRHVSFTIRNGGSPICIIHDEILVQISELRPGRRQWVNDFGNNDVWICVAVISVLDLGAIGLFIIMQSFPSQAPNARGSCKDNMCSLLFQKSRGVGQVPP